MTSERNTKTLVRGFLPWNDSKQERWLTEQARSGWHLKAVHGWGYTLERGGPADVAYRLDVSPRCRADREEYFALFRDAGWEHVGTRGIWQIFRKPVVGGVVPEIHTDAGSRIAMYQRVVGFFAIMLTVMVTQLVPQLSRQVSSAAVSGFPVFLVILVLLVAILVVGIVKLALVVNRLKKLQKLAG